MAWKHGPKPAEKLWLRRKEMEYETQLNACSWGLRLIVVGGEEYPHRLVVETILGRVHRTRGIKEVIVADSTRVSYWAEQWAKHERAERTMVACNLAREGKNAVFCRNAEMLKLKPDGVIAFPGEDEMEMFMIQAKRAGVKVWRPIRER